MRFDITRVAATQMPVDRFLQEYYLPEKPVLISGLTPPDMQVVFRLLKHQDGFSGFGFIGTPLPSNDEALKVPAIVEAVLSRDDIIIRARPMRVWLQSAGLRTYTHFDGNSLHGLSWHVAGSKQWTLISPDTPPRFYPFSYLSMESDDFQPDENKHDFCQFQTAPGDFLFLPRYWSHSVTSIEAVNANLNWVFTPRSPNLNVRVGRRECAVLAWRDKIPALERLQIKSTSIRNYGGGGEELFQVYSQALSNRQLLTALIAEFPALFLLPFYRRKVVRQAQSLAQATRSTLDQYE